MKRLGKNVRTVFVLSFFERTLCHTLSQGKTYKVVDILDVDVYNSTLEMLY